MVMQPKFVRGLHFIWYQMVQNLFLFSTPVLIAEAGRIMERVAVRRGGQGWWLEEHLSVSNNGFIVLMLR